jgi:sugar phosphate isomerase/epimerase
MQIDQVKISGFSDEISSDFEEQLKGIEKLNLHYLCLRSADGKGIADYSVSEAEKGLFPRLLKAGVRVSSLGSPIGKIDFDDDQGFKKQLDQLDVLCRISRLLNCRYIRIFSFYIPKGRKKAPFREMVLEKVRALLFVAEKHQVILLNENEKGVYGDTGSSCLDLMETLDHPLYRSAFDFANFVQCGEDTETCWNMLHRYISYIHIKDAVSSSQENVLCGTGEGKIALLLQRAFLKENYNGFLTLEPHLVRFDSLGSLERKGAEEIIRTNKAASGAEAFAMQYQALCRILRAI